MRKGKTYEVLKVLKKQQKMKISDIVDAVSKTHGFSNVPEEKINLDVNKALYTLTKSKRIRRTESRLYEFVTEKQVTFRSKYSQTQSEGEFI